MHVSMVLLVLLITFLISLPQGGARLIMYGIDARSGMNE